MSSQPRPSRSRAPPARFRRTNTPGSRDFSRSRSPSPAFSVSTVIVKKSTLRIGMVCRVHGTQFNVMAVADTGAALSIFPKSSIPEGTPVQPSSTRLKAANGTGLSNDGAVMISASLGEGPKTEIRAIVSADLHGPPLISYRDMRKMGTEVNFPKGTPVEEPSDLVGSVTAINLVSVDQQFLGEGTDSLDRIK